ncbi:MAG: Crp/Fnr family transcriptional regulator [Flavobacteriales bacterium]|nr:Crp/Fnr family transcriptional regulator [Flavobacteriales bacterium]
MNTPGLELILQNISRFIELNSGEIDFFVSLLKPHHLRRRQFLLQEGMVCNYTAFVYNGCLRSYSVDSNGFEHILQFAIEDWWIGDMYSLVTRQPGFLTIDALEESDVLLLHRDDQLRLFNEVPKFERFFRILLEKSMVMHQLRLMENISMPAAQRYQIFASRYPQIIARVPQTQIAAYLGITPEFLSKIKKDLLRKK